MIEIEQYNPDADAYVEGLARGVIMMQKCTACTRVQFPPRVHCANCGTREIGFVQVDGRGTVYAKTTNRRAPEDAFKPLLPYVVALVDLAVGVRVMARADCAPEEVATGGSVRVYPDPKPVLLPGLLFVPADRDEAEEK